jgi:hypothetical protein
LTITNDDPLEVGEGMVGDGAGEITGSAVEDDVWVIIGDATAGAGVETRLMVATLARGMAKVPKTSLLKKTALEVMEMIFPT